MHGLNLGIKSCIFIFTFIWIRASFPRIRFDQLMSFCWTVLLPIIFAFIILVPCILYSFDILPANSNISLFSVLPLLLTNRANVNLKDNPLKQIADNLEFKLSRRPLYKEERVNYNSKNTLRSGIVSMSFLNSLTYSRRETESVVYFQLICVALILVPCILHSLMYSLLI